jgi:hypothetical protein
MKIFNILTVIISFFLAVSCSSSKSAQTLSEKNAVIETINRMCISVDSRDWNKVGDSFDHKVVLDYTSMSGGKPSTLTPVEIINAWKSLLPGFDATHHQTGNFLVEINGNQAEAFCYGTATHYLKNNSGKNIWTVVGTYNASLKKIENQWKINKFKFNLQYTDGNNDLPKLAQERIKK